MQVEKFNVPVWYEESHCHHSLLCFCTFREASFRLGVVLHFGSCLSPIQPHDCQDAFALKFHTVVCMFFVTSFLSFAMHRCIRGYAPKPAAEMNRWGSGRQCIHLGSLAHLFLNVFHLFERLIIRTSPLLCWWQESAASAYQSRLRASAVKIQED